MPSASELGPETVARLSAKVPRRSAGRGRALALAAIRETFEETGLLVGRRVANPPAHPDGDPAWLHFQERGVLPDLAAITFVARAITPPGRSRRFDARFFAVERQAIGDEAPGFVGPGKELVELAWLELASARGPALHPITAAMLDEIELRIAQGFSPGLPVPFYREMRGRSIRELI